MYRVTFIALCTTAVVIVAGGINHISRFNYYKTQTYSLQKDNKDLTESIEALNKASVEKDKFINKLKEESAQNEALMSKYKNDLLALQEQDKALASSRKEKEKAVSKQKEEFLRAHPELRGDAATDLKFMQLTSVIRIDAIKEQYCALFGCKK